MIDFRQKVETAKKFGKFLERIAHAALNVALVGAAVFLVEPDGYAALKNWRDHTVVVSVDPGKGIEDVASKLTAEDFRQIRCLAINSYFEAGNQGEAGMKAVDDVVANRVKSGLYPDTACQVIYQHSGKHCEFSWYCDGKNHVVTDQARWDMAYETAYNAYLYQSLMPDMSSGATFYHATYINPDWSKKIQTTKLGQHVFFKPDPGRGH